MSWSRRALLLAAAALGGCGFSPVLAPGGAADDLRGKVDVVAPANRPGYSLTRRLEERLGLPQAPVYTLRVTITQGAQVTGIPADRVAARINIVGEVDYALIDNATNRAVTRGSVQNFTGYSSTSTTAATRSARIDAEDRLMTILADQVVNELLAMSAEWR